MGVAICVGSLAADQGEDPEYTDSLRQDFEQINRVLRASQLPEHSEPEDLPDFPYRGQLLGFPYSWLHYLRRAVAFARQAPAEFCPLAEDANPADDPRVDDELSCYFDSHFICHSDSQGFYVPIDFPEPLYDDELSGGILGSSQRALAEVMQAAPLLGIPLENGVLSDDAARAIVTEVDESHPYGIARKVWLTMFEAFRHSVEYNTAVIYS
jgi:hypothetical protein